MMYSIEQHFVSNIFLSRKKFLFCCTIQCQAYISSDAISNKTLQKLTLQKIFVYDFGFQQKIMRLTIDNRTEEKQDHFFIVFKDDEI